MELDEHLFRREFGRIVAALVRIFGVHDLALAEDVAQDACVRALEVWKTQGLPDNPAAWLTATAKHRAIDVLRRERTARTFAPAVTRAIEDGAIETVLDDAFAGVRDEQLRMMFTCCQPRLPEEIQLALVLNILCGFGAPEIAAAFLTSRAAIEKRITRGKQQLASDREWFELDDAELPRRLATVQRALYLLFSEGYHGSSAVRSELCAEALRLVALLCELPAAATPETHALAALMCLHAARLPARLDAHGELELFVDQDRRRWDHALLTEGLAWFERAATGETLTAFHIEAAIAVVHASAVSAERTDWNAIVELYDRLMTIASTPVIALNRGVAIGQRDGAVAGLRALRQIADPERLERYPFYPAALGELELRRGDTSAARACFRSALTLARNDAERHFLEKRLAGIVDVENRAPAPTHGRKDKQ